MKVIKAQEMGRIEALAYQEGASEEAFMYTAGERVAERARNFLAKEHLKPKITLLCGSGNNAGDAYVAGTFLQQGGFEVEAFALAPTEKSSPLCQKQQKVFVQEGGKLSFARSSKELDLSYARLLIDGVLGTGFRGTVEGLFADAIDAANHSQIPILSIDVPSGIDGNTGAIGGIAMEATQTLFLGLPKSGCFLGDAWNHTGKAFVADFGLGEKYLVSAEEDFLFLHKGMVRHMLPPVKRNRHKYEAGYVVGLGGSPGMPGAPMMTAHAALRSGAGIVRLLHPLGMEAELANTPYELVRQGYRPGDTKAILTAMERASALFIGPGIGVAPASLRLLKKLLPRLDKPCVIDADALTLIAEGSLPVPPLAILTPHHGEMKRLLGKEPSSLLDATQAYAEKHNVIIVLKGAPTFIFTPSTTPFVCPRGDPGMATAGSGDVLTGMIAASLAQHVHPVDAALMSVYIHALAGEHAASLHTSTCMTATDITASLPHIFSSF